MSAAEIIARCRRLAQCTEVPGETTRLFLSPAMQEVHNLLRQWMEDAGMRVRVDAAGNLRGLYEGDAANARRLVMGSHLDTVPNAGAFDGVLGVLLAVTLVEELGGKRLPFAIEVIGFSEEEGVRFGKPFLGCLGLLGRLDADALALQDHKSISVAQALRSFGLDPLVPGETLLDARTFAFVEFHIEQGPVLESIGRPLGVVAAVAGQTRLTIAFAGQSNHAGTTPMQLRHDALAAAAQWIGEVEAYAAARPGLVATVGRLEVLPGSPNVVPGRVLASLDVRHTDNGERKAAVAAMLDATARAGEQRGVSSAVLTMQEQAAVPMDRELVDGMSAAARRAGYPADAMTSGAGHDAMILAAHVPAVMLFVRSPGGLSHHPEESVLLGDVEAALATGTEFLKYLHEHCGGSTG